MIRKPLRMLAGLSLVGLLGVVAIAPAGATARSQTATQGITDDEIEIVALVADLDGLRAGGANLPAKLTTGNLLKRWQAFADAYGPINGRKVVVKPAVWTPGKTTTFDSACTQATQDNKPFVVVNGNGYQQSSLSCITVDNETPMFFGESVYDDLVKASQGRLVSLGLTAESNAATTASLVKKGKLLSKKAKVGILSGNEPGVKAAGDALQKELKKAGYKVVKKVEVNNLNGDVPAQNRESTAAVATFQAAGVDTVFVSIPFTANGGFFQEKQRTNATFDTFLLDAASSLCTQYGAIQIPPEAAGTPCITTWDTRALPTKDGVKQDNALEATCREQFDAATGQQSTAGVPAASDFTAGGVSYVEDIPPNECTIMSVLLPAIEKAGKDPTWAKVYKNLLKSGKGAAAYMSDGEGEFTKTKPYYATQVHLESFNAAPRDTPKDAATGTFNGCPVPVNCFVPQLIDGQEWFPVVQR